VHIIFLTIEFDPAKDAINKAKHGVTLRSAVRFEWDTALERADDRFDYGEARFVAIGVIDSRLFVLVFTESLDNDTVRIISLRPAEKHEMRFYRENV